MRIQPASGEVSTPIATSAFTARGVRPSPQTFSRGKAVFSSTSTSRPVRARWYAVAEPAGPAPTTMTSASASLGAGRFTERGSLVTCEDFHERLGSSYGERVARCRATMPPLRFRQPTPAQPARPITAASAGWSGQSRIDSAR